MFPHKNTKTQKSGQKFSATIIMHTVCIRFGLQIFLLLFKIPLSLTRIQYKMQIFYSSKADTLLSNCK